MVVKRTSETLPDSFWKRRSRGNPVIPEQGGCQNDTKKSGTAVIPSLCAWRKGRFLLPKNQ